MKRYAYLLLPALISCSIYKKNDDGSLNSGHEVFADPQFKDGFSVTPLDPKTVRQGGGFEKTYVDTMDFGKISSRPVWQAAQWYSKYSFAGAKPEKGKNGIIYSNEGGSKRLGWYEDDHSLLLEVNASKEYDKPRVKGEQWPHLLIAQRFHERSPNVAAAKKLLFSYAIQVLKCENKMATGTFNRALHTTHTPLFFVVRNVNKQSKDYNQSIWFGIPSFDYRDRQLPDKEKIMWDIGTSKYIYNLSPRMVWGDVQLGDGQWHKTHIDLKPLIEKALDAMKSKEVFLNTTTEDLNITEMNFGWEVPGTFDAAVKIKDLSLLEVKKIAN